MIQNVLEGKKYRVITGYENNSVVSSDNNEEYMGYALNIYRYTGIVGAYGNTSLYSADDEYEENNVKIDNEISVVFMSLSDAMFQKSLLWLDTSLWGTYIIVLKKNMIQHF